MSGITCMMPYDTNSVTVVSSPAQTQLTRTPSSTVQHEMAPYCMICSYRQAEERPYPMFHFHSSPREVRILQGVEYTTSNPDYMCPTCRVMHSTFPDYGLNVCLGTSQLHNFHQPWDPTVTCPPDPFHIDWVTISGGTIPDLTQAFTVDYRRQPRPMRIFVTAGLNDLLRGTSRDTIVERFIHLKETIDAQNVYHPHAKNELVIATILNPPKLVWFDANGPPPPNHINQLKDIKEINDWLKTYNKANGRVCTPSFHRFGVRTLRGVQSHQLSQWRQSEPISDMVHLNDYWRVKMGQAVIKHFRGERDRFGTLD